MLHPNISEKDGILFFAGVDTLALAQKYGTPLYLLDMDCVRSQCGKYYSALAKYAPAGGRALYASKALCFKGIYPVIEKEGMFADVVSCGEIYTALKAGYPAEKLYFHSNNKTPDDVAFAMDSGVGYFVVDNPEELRLVGQAAKKRGIKQKIYLRVSPGIDPHTFEAVSTGQLDSKFGAAIETGDALGFVKAALAAENVDLCGLHCHIGSQIFDSQPFLDAVDVMISFMADVKAQTGWECPSADIGGGLGVRYVESDPECDIDSVIRSVCERISSRCSELGLKPFELLLEPGRSIVAAAGLTLYTVGSVKELPGIRNYVCVDGSMTDNPRYCLYGSEYTVYNCSRAGDEPDYICTVAGRCCESGDMIGEGLPIAKPAPGDVLAVCSTGAYNYSMASNYNRLPRPALVILENGRDRLGIRRETFEDLLLCDE